MSDNDKSFENNDNIEVKEDTPMTKVDISANNETCIEKVEKPRSTFNFNINISIIIVFIIVVIVGSFLFFTKDKNEPVIITSSTLQEIIDLSDLSTVEAVYNGIARVNSDLEPDKIIYYVSYKSKVRAGIDFKQIDVQVDDENKKVIVKLPRVKITDIDVDITSLDYIFVDKRANTSTVTMHSYKKCIEDVESKTARANAIFDLAEQNAKNAVEALIKPFLEHQKMDYVLEIL